MTVSERVSERDFIERERERERERECVKERHTSASEKEADVKRKSVQSVRDMEE